MNVAQLKTQQKSLRTSFTLSTKTMEEELSKEVPNLTKLSILRLQIGDKISRLEQCQMNITNLFLEEENSDVSYEEDFIKAEKYRDKFSELCARVERMSVKENENKEVHGKKNSSY
ncbi:uncharacterized protein TNCT_275541 [Trichonephila clavata]|uniref:Uncharacterized protein n=1 Tax=Trichonephila clavata TaxID=2740835 RepID=A0A8X6J7Q5_TRICU|nr:uncharacterized protein TNCT_275541 [Trichonephila clavata]